MDLSFLWPNDLDDSSPNFYLGVQEIVRREKAEEGESIDIVHSTRKGVHELFV